jgi:hypothetical protein
MRIRTQGAKPMQIKTNPYPGQTLNFYIKKKLKYLVGEKNTYEGAKAFLKDQKPGLFVNFGQFSESLTGSEKTKNRYSNKNPEKTIATASTEAKNLKILLEGSGQKNKNLVLLDD